MSDLRAKQARVQKFSRSLKKAETKAEKALRLALDRAGIFYRPQRYFFNAHRACIVDFCLATTSQKLVIEVDGGSHRGRELDDARRTEWLKRYRNAQVMRFTNSQVLGQEPWVIEQILLKRPKMRATVEADKQREEVPTWNKS